jgi:hypothetical protein
MLVRNKNYATNYFQTKISRENGSGASFINPMDAFFLWQLISGMDSSAENIFGAIFFSLIVAAIPYAFVRRVVFDAHSFSIEKYTNSLLLFGLNISIIRLHNGLRDGAVWGSQSWNSRMLHREAFARSERRR